jgi:ribonuclease VapC
VKPDIVLDSHALLAYLEDEPGADVVQEILSQSEAGKKQALMTSVNLGEVYYSLIRTHGGDKARKLLDVIDQLPLEILAADRELALTAGELKAKNAVAFADCFSAALAAKHSCPVVTGDPEFKILELYVSVSWI